VKLDLSSFKKALGSLQRAIERAEAARKDEELRDAVIKRFEYTYELSWKMLKRRLELDAPNPADIDQMSFKDLIREGAERGLVRDPEQWMGFREQRNISSHTYDEKKAASVYKTALNFYPESRVLYDELAGRHDH